MESAEHMDEVIEEDKGRGQSSAKLSKSRKSKSSQKPTGANWKEIRRKQGAKTVTVLVEGSVRVVRLLPHPALLTENRKKKETVRRRVMMEMRRIMATTTTTTIHHT
jgi:hypothetical protein